MLRLYFWELFCLHLTSIEVWVSCYLHISLTAFVVSFCLLGQVYNSHYSRSHLALLISSYCYKISIGLYECAIHSLYFDWLDLNNSQTSASLWISQWHPTGSPLWVSWAYRRHKLNLVDRLMLSLMLLSVLFLCIVPPFQCFALGIPAVPTSPNSNGWLPVSKITVLFLVSPPWNTLRKVNHGMKPDFHSFFFPSFLRNQILMMTVV